jgi:hypothetical protein
MLGNDSEESESPLDDDLDPESEILYLRWRILDRLRRQLDDLNRAYSLISERLEDAIVDREEAWTVEQLHLRLTNTAQLWSLSFQSLEFVELCIRTM